MFLNRVKYDITILLLRQNMPYIAWGESVEPWTYIVALSKIANLIEMFLIILNYI